MPVQVHFAPLSQFTRHGPLSWQMMSQTVPLAHVVSQPPTGHVMAAQAQLVQLPSLHASVQTLGDLHAVHLQSPPPELPPPLEPPPLEPPPPDEPLTAGSGSNSAS